MDGKFYKHYTIYRVRYASKFEVRIGDNAAGKERAMLFWVVAEPTGEKMNDKPTFCWDRNKYPGKQATFLLSEKDAAEILCVLKGKKDAVGFAKAGATPQLFHKNNRGSTTLSFTPSLTDNGMLKGFQFRIGCKVGSEPAKSFSHDISIDEAEVLEILLTEFIKLKYSWN